MTAHSGNWMPPLPHCPICGKAIKQQSQDQIIDRVMTLDEGQRFAVLAPVVRGKKGRHEKVFADAKRSGFARVRVDGAIYDLSENIELDKNEKHSVDIVVDRVTPYITEEALVYYHPRRKIAD